MTRRTLLALSITLLAGCASNDNPPPKVIVGATLLNPNAAPIENSMIVVSGSRIQRAGTQADVPVPPGSEKIAGYGKFITPAKPEEPIVPGSSANLKLFSADPRQNPQAAPERVLSEGEWTK